MYNTKKFLYILDITINTIMLYMLITALRLLFVNNTLKLISSYCFKCLCHELNVRLIVTLMGIYVSEYWQAFLDLFQKLPLYASSAHLSNFNQSLFVLHLDKISLLIFTIFSCYSRTFKSEKTVSYSIKYTRFN